VGSTVKVSVVLPNDDRLSVQMPRYEFEQGGLGQGDSVRLDLREVEVRAATSP
jgi:hypothetical protein